MDHPALNRSNDHSTAYITTCMNLERSEGSPPSAAPSSSVLASSPQSPLDLDLPYLTLPLLTPSKPSPPASTAADNINKNNNNDHQGLGDLLTLSLQTVVGSSEILGHSLENRDSISSLQDPAMALAVQEASLTPLRDPSQENLFIIAPLDVLVTHEEPIMRPDGKGLRRNRFHIIEINGTGIAGEVVSKICLCCLPPSPSSSPPSSHPLHSVLLSILPHRSNFPWLVVSSYLIKSCSASCRHHKHGAFSHPIHDEVNLRDPCS